jgi:single-strand DNA-binding protein
LSIDPIARVLPSGDEVVTFRVVVPRDEGRADALDVAIWAAGLRRRALAWKVGDVVTIEGAVRRRFWRTPTGAASRWEIEARTATRWRRA